MAKRLAELGPVECARHSSGPAAASLARHAIELKRAQLQEGGIASPALADPRMADFFADAADGLGRPAGLNVVSLASNGTVAAINIFIGCKDRAALHIATFDTNFKKASVGTLLLEQSIGQSFSDDYRTFDFLAPAEHYKLQLADGVVGTNDWVVPLSLKGSLFARVYLGLCAPGHQRERSPRCPCRCAASSRTATRTELAPLADAELLLQARGRGRVLEQQLLARVDVLVGLLRHQRRLVEAG